jgi:hypothetical protein
MDEIIADLPPAGERSAPTWDMSGLISLRSAHKRCGGGACAYEADEERELRLCFCLVAMLMSSLPAHNVGRKTLKRPGSTSLRHPWGSQSRHACS